MRAPDAGQVVEVRQRPWVVVDVVRSAFTPDPIRTAAGEDALVALASIEDDGLGEELQVLWGVEPSRAIHERSDLPDLDGFDAPEVLDCFVDAVRWGAVSSADVRALQAPFRSGIQIEDYHLDPVARALTMPRVNLLLADDVGLGKTIETGLVVQELLRRHRARTVLVVCPSALQVQWQEQMRDKFGLRFEIIDSDKQKELRRPGAPRRRPDQEPPILPRRAHAARDRRDRRGADPAPAADRSRSRPHRRAHAVQPLERPRGPAARARPRQSARAAGGDPAGAGEGSGQHPPALCGA